MGFLLQALTKYKNESGLYSTNAETLQQDHGSEAALQRPYIVEFLRNGIWRVRDSKKPVKKCRTPLAREKIILV
jgi:hypothetical protein